MSYLLACVRWRSNVTGHHYCEYYDKRTGEFLAIGIAHDAKAAELKATRKLSPLIRRKFPSLELAAS